MRPVEVLRAWFDAHARGDLEAARRLVVDDVEIDMSGSRLRGFDLQVADRDARERVDDSHGL